jgi:hypothetical protein
LEDSAMHVHSIRLIKTVLMKYTYLTMLSNTGKAARAADQESHYHSSIVYPTCSPTQF